MSSSLFNEHGRIDPVDLTAAAYRQSRRYFLCDTPDIDLADVFTRTCGVLGTPDDLTVDDFRDRVGQTLSTLASNPETANIIAGVHIPFLIPRNDSLGDLGVSLEEHYLPALERTFLQKFPDSDFAVETSSLAGRVVPVEGSRHERLIQLAEKESVVGIYFPCMTEYSIPAAIEQVGRLPENFLATGGLDLIAALIAAPGLLIRKDGYPPTLWLTAIQAENENVGYHFEAYGYNLKFYRRSHLGLTSEYWWQGVTVLPD